VPEIPSFHAIAALLVTIVTFVLFASGRMRIELICLLVIAVLAVGFYVFPLHTEGALSGLEIAFGGFGHEALIAIASLMILGRGLVVTGALEPAARVLARLWRMSRVLGMLCTLLVCMVISGFINDTPVLVLTMPIILDLARRVGLSASQTLMPVNAAILIGGMATTIGTSTNVLVVSIATDMGLPRLGMFAFFQIVATAALVAFPYLWLGMPRLLPKIQTTGGESPRVFRATLHLTTRSSVVGKTREAVDNVVSGGVRIVSIKRGAAPVGEGELAAGDRILFEGAVDQIRDLSSALRAPLAPEHLLSAVGEPTDASDPDLHIAELAVGGDSSLIGKSVREARIADRFGVLIVGTYRASESHLFGYSSGPTEDRLEVGDVLLAQGTEDHLRDLEQAEGVMQLIGTKELPRTAKAPIALLIVAAVVVLAAFKIVPIAIAALAGTIAMLAAGCVKYENLGRALSVEVIVLVAASIALGRALVETGAADWLASLLAIGLVAAPAAVVLASLMVFAAILTNFVSNAAAAAIGTPLAMSLATQLSLQPEPLVIAVLFGCNLCYVTPMAYQTNLLIMGAAGYSFRDFVRAGLPLAILMIVTLAYLLVHKYAL